MVVVVRQVTEEDRFSLAELLSDGMGRDPGVWTCRFHHWWDDNPSMSSTVARGWVLEDNQNGLVGFMGNIPRPFQLGSKEVISYSATSILVLPRYRAHTPKLFHAFFSQKGADLLLMTSTATNTPAGKLLQAFGAKEIPLQSFEDTLVWVVDPVSLLRSALIRKGLKPWMVRAATLVGAMPTWGWMKIRWNGLRRVVGQMKIVDISEPTDIFDDLWNDLHSAYFATGIRGSKQMRWHCYHPYSELQRHYVVAAVTSSGQTEGYFTYRFEQREDIGLRRLQVVDMFIHPENNRAIRALISHLLRVAAESNAQIVEVVGGAENISAALRTLKPIRRRRPSKRYFYKAIDPEIMNILADPQSWHATYFDGDESLL